MVALTMVRSEAEAEVLCGMLRANGVACGYQQTNVGAGAADGFSRGGALEIFVAEGDAQQARELLRSNQRGPS
jgi:putative signal transducing protein